MTRPDERPDYAEGTYEEDERSAQDMLDDLGFYDSRPCPHGPYVHHPGKRCLGCGRVS